MQQLSDCRAKNGEVETTPLQPLQRNSNQETKAKYVQILTVIYSPVFINFQILSVWNIHLLRLETK